MHTSAIAATRSFTLTSPKVIIQGDLQSWGHLTPFLHPSLSEIWLLQKDITDNVSKTT